MTAPTKRRVGRPRKQPENPDCEPATKGYVKCLMRKSLAHSHAQNVTFGVIASALVIGGLLTLCLALGEGQTWKALSPQWFAPMLMFTMSCLVVMIDLMRSDAERVCCNSTSGINEIQKYEPPCEPKRGCEEQE